MINNHVIFRFLGLQDYLTCWQKMKEFTSQRLPETPDEIWILEHPPVFTQGQNGKPEHVLNPGEIPVIPIDRGGQVTFHGPGQLIAYVLIDVKRKKLNVRELVTALEQSVIQLLLNYHLSATSKCEAPGIYIDNKKIASIGLRIKRGCSYHGLALNVDMDLEPFSRINPCGYSQLQMTQLSEWVTAPPIKSIGLQLIECLSANLGYTNKLIKTTNGNPAFMETKTFASPTQKQRGAEKLARIPVKIEASTTLLRKPDWIRIRIPASPAVADLKKILRDNKLVTVCEEASCPNLPECFSHGTATFMIMGDKCTRRCSFCDVAHGRPDPLDTNEPLNLAKTIAQMGLKYVVITSVDRDDLRDGGASHFSACLKEIRAHNPTIKIEVLVPDYRGRMDIALEATGTELPDVFNHNIETVPRLYKQARPGSDYAHSLLLLKVFKSKFSHIPTKSGLMLGLGETNEEIEQTLIDLRTHDVDMLTLGQYLQPSKFHMPVSRYITPEEFQHFAILAKKLGFSKVASGPLVRSSYHADKQASGEEVT